MTDRLYIVVIDSDKSMCKALTRLLRSAQMDVDTFVSSDTFLHSIDGETPDCLILNIQTSGMTGTALRSRLASLGRFVPVVYITAANGVDVARGADGDEVLHKPFDDQVLLEAIDRAIQAKPR